MNTCQPFIPSGTVAARPSALNLSTDSKPSRHVSQPLSLPQNSGARAFRYSTEQMQTHMNAHSRWTSQCVPRIPRGLAPAARLVLRQAVAQGPCLDARCTWCCRAQLFARRICSAIGDVAVCDGCPMLMEVRRLLPLWDGMDDHVFVNKQSNRLMPL